MDIGEKLGTIAAMGTLLRTQSGRFTLETAMKLSQIKNAAEDGTLEDLILPVEEVLPFPRAYVKAEGVLMAKNGNPLPLKFVEMPAGMPEKVWLHSPSGLVGLYCLDLGRERLTLEVLM